MTCNIGTPDESELEVGHPGRLGLGRRQPRGDLFHQKVHSQTVGGRYRNQILRAGCIELGKPALLRGRIDLVNDSDKRASGLADQRQRFLVRFAETEASVEHEYDHIGDADGAKRLRDHTLRHRLAAELEPAAVDDGKIAPGPRGASEIEIAGSAGDRAGDRASALCNAVEQGRFACVGAPYENHGGQTAGKGARGFSLAPGRRCVPRAAHNPYSATLRGSRVHPGSTFTTISRKTRVPKISSSSRRAAVPICLRVLPPAPISIPLCESRSTMMSIAIRLSLRSGSSVNFSTRTAVENGISCRIARKIFSRTTSSAIIRSVWSVYSSSGIRLGPAGSIPFTVATRSSTFSPLNALTGTISHPGNSRWSSSIMGNTRWRGMRSTLLITITIGAFKALNSRSSSRSAGSLDSPAAITPSTTSPSANARRAASTIRRFSSRPDSWTPGVSMMRSWASESFRIPRMRRRVVCGRGVTIATLWPTIRLRSVDLPTFERPPRTTNPARCSGALVTQFLLEQVERFARGRLLALFLAAARAAAEFAPGNANPRGKAFGVIRALG